MEFKSQLDKLFEGRAAEDEFAMSSNNLLQNSPSLHSPLDSRLSSQESQPRGKQTYLEKIDEEFGDPLSDQEGLDFSNKDQEKPISRNSHSDLNFSCNLDKMPSPPSKRAKKKQEHRNLLLKYVIGEYNE